MAKFLRECFITVLETPSGKPDVVIKQVWGYDQNKKANFPTGLRLSFTIDKQLTDVADTATLRIYNLNRESRKALAQRSIYLYKTERVRTLQIQAGYADNFGALFTGGIERVTNTRQGPDWITEIKASSALAQIIHNVFDRNWQSDAGTPAFDISKVAIKNAYGVEGDGVVYSDAARALLQKAKIPSFLASGNAHDTVRKLMRGLGLMLTVDMGKVIVVQPGNPISIDLTDTVTVNEFSGLIGSPMVDDMGYEFRTLIDHRISVGELVKVEAQTLEESIPDKQSIPGLKTLATAWTINIRGDTHSDDWYMDVKTLFYPPQVSPMQNIGKQPALHPDIERQL